MDITNLWASCWEGKCYRETSFSVILLVSGRGEEARKQLLISLAVSINSARVGCESKTVGGHCSCESLTLALCQIRMRACVLLHLWGSLQINKKSVAFCTCTKLSPVIKRKEYWVKWERVFLLQCAGSDVQGSACMCPCSLCARFMPDSAADPVELFSSVAFLKNLFVECFHIQKVMFAFLFLCCKKCKQGKQKLFFKMKRFWKSETLAERPDSFFLFSIDFSIGNTRERKGQILTKHEKCSCFTVSKQLLFFPAFSVRNFVVWSLSQTCPPSPAPWVEQPLPRSPLAYVPSPLSTSCVGGAQREDGMTLLLSCWIGEFLVLLAPCVWQSQVPKHGCGRPWVQQSALPPDRAYSIDFIDAPVGLYWLWPSVAWLRPEVVVKQTVLTNLSLEEWMHGGERGGCELWLCSATAWASPAMLSSSVLMCSRTHRLTIALGCCKN